MRRRSRRRKAVSRLQMGLLIMCLGWQLGESYHAAVQLEGVCDAVSDNRHAQTRTTPMAGGFVTELSTQS